MEMEKVTPDKVLKDPDFYQLPEFERIKVLEKIDPDFKTLPKEEKLKVVTAFADKSKDELQSLFVKEAPIYEKAWRQFAHGSGQLVETIGELFDKVSKGITYDPLMQFYTHRVAEDIKQIGNETKNYWKADEYQNKFHGLGGEIVNALIRETPSLIAFNPGMKATGSLAMSALSPKSRVAKSVVESLGTGAGYTAVNLAGRENYDLKDAGIDSLIDFGVGVASPHVARIVKAGAKKVSPFIDDILSELKSVFKTVRKTKNKEATVKVAESYKAAKNGDNQKLLESTDELLNMDNLPEEAKKQIKSIQKKIKATEDLPEPVKEVGAESTDAYVDLKLDEIKPAKINTPLLKGSDVKEAWDYFENNILGKEFTSPIGHKIKLKEGHFFRLIAGSGNKSQKKGFIAKANSPQEAIQLIKEGKVKPEDVFGFEKTRAKYLPLIPDIIENPQMILKQGKDKYYYFKTYKTNGEIGLLGIFIDFKEGGVNIVSFHPKNIKSFLKKAKKKNYELIWPSTRYPAPGRLSANGQMEAGTPPVDSANNNISPKPENGNTELYAGIPVSKIFEGADYIEKQVKDKLLGENVVAFWDRNFNDPEKVFKKMGKEKYYDLVKRAFEKQERLEKGYRKIMERINSQLKTDSDREIFENILHIRDKFEIEDITDIEKALGNPIPENIKKAYKAFDSGMKWAARQLDLDNPVYGYVPHVFNNYYVTDKNGNILATFKKQVDAEKFIKKNAGLVEPKVKEFKFKLVNAEDLEDPKKFKEALRERMNRLSFHRYIGFKEKRKGVGGWENFPYLVYDNEGNVIGRFKTLAPAQKFAAEKKGKLVELQALPEKSLLSDVEWYLHKTARYRAMEDVKPKLIRMFLSDYGLNLPKDTPVEELKNAISRIQDPNKRREAEYIAEFINDVLGRPRKGEESLNNFLKRNKKLMKIAERLGLAYGDRPGLVMINKTHKALSHVYLGFGKPIQLIVQLSTIPTNTWTLLAKQLADSGVKHDLVKAGEFVTKALYDFATNKRLRALSWRMVSDAPTLADINQYTGKTFAKGIAENISLAPLTIGDRTARAIAFLAKYEQLKAMGYKGNKAKLAKEFAMQTNFNMKVYDTPPALRNPLIRFYMMFKPFLIKELNFLLSLPWKYRIAGSMMLATFLGTHAMLGYEIGEWLGINDWLYEHVGKPLEEQLVKAGVMSREKLQELREYGILGALTGISLYQNMGLGDIFGAALSPVKDAYNAITGKGATSSAPLTYVANIIRTLDDISNQDWEKAKEDFVKLLPSYLRKVKDAVDILTTGYIYRKGRPIIKGTTKDAIALLLGGTPVKLQKFYNMKQELRGVKEDRRIGRDKLMQRLQEAYINKDKQTYIETVKQLIQEGYYKDQRAVQQALFNYMFSRRVPSEIMQYAKPEARMLLMKKSKGELQELYNKFYKEYQNTKDPFLRKGYERALRNIMSVMKSGD
ncbi:hypothetical protein [Persephonella sp.]|uniref:hypothetical protein n=1 Tax=Persephonella sp. TaxID=2060922 RepID=UPI002630553B|nr:hypothetical protein [Persephonella sp.]